MKAARDRDNNAVVLTMTPQEAHVVIWGGPEPLFDQLNSEIRQELVKVEDADFTDAEYKQLFDDLTGMYAELRKERQ